eukprot:6201482-Pleurochrysis_carterae.AAC.1
MPRNSLPESFARTQTLNSCSDTSPKPLQVKKKLLKLQSESCDAWEHLNQMEFSDISTAALPAGVYTCGETTNNAAE